MQGSAVRDQETSAGGLALKLHLEFDQLFTSHETGQPKEANLTLLQKVQGAETCGFSVSPFSILLQSQHHRKQQRYISP